MYFQTPGLELTPEKAKQTPLDASQDCDPGFARLSFLAAEGTEHVGHAKMNFEDT